MPRGKGRMECMRPMYASLGTQKYRGRGRKTKQCKREKCLSNTQSPKSKLVATRQREIKTL